MTNMREFLERNGGSGTYNAEYGGCWIDFNSKEYLTIDGGMTLMEMEELIRLWKEKHGKG